MASNTFDSIYAFQNAIENKSCVQVPMGPWHSHLLPIWQFCRTNGSATIAELKQLGLIGAAASNIVEYGRNIGFDAYQAGCRLLLPTKRTPSEYAHLVAICGFTSATFHEYTDEQIAEQADTYLQLHEPERIEGLRTAVASQRVFFSRQPDPKVYTRIDEQFPAIQTVNSGEPCGCAMCARYRCPKGGRPDKIASATFDLIEYPQEQHGALFCEDEQPPFEDIVTLRPYHILLLLPVIERAYVFGRTLQFTEVLAMFPEIWGDRTMTGLHWLWKHGHHVAVLRSPFERVLSKDMKEIPDVVLDSEKQSTHVEEVTVYKTEYKRDRWYDYTMESILTGMSPGSDAAEWIAKASVVMNASEYPRKKELSMCFLPFIWEQYGTELDRVIQNADLNQLEATGGCGVINVPLNEGVAEQIEGWYDLLKVATTIASVARIACVEMS